MAAVASSGVIASAEWTDPLGHQWGIATHKEHKEDVAPQDLPGRQQEFFAKAAAGRR